MLFTPQHWTYIPYDENFTTHQPRSIFEHSSPSKMNLIWDFDGNLIGQRVCDTWNRSQIWDEEDRLRVVMDDMRAGYYGYDANGQRVVKLFGNVFSDCQNGNDCLKLISFDDGVLYPNPYVVVTPQGYTKHYYAGSERIATRIGVGCLGGIVERKEFEDDWFDNYFDAQKWNEGYEKYSQSINRTIDDEYMDELNPYCDIPWSSYVKINIPYGLFDQTFKCKEEFPRSLDGYIFFYHGDHLGSASWITGNNGDPVQYIHYAPYGELIDNQTPFGYDERFKFTGKEKDWESGYNYHEARFLWSEAGIWLSVDQLVDKYIYQSPYIYCNGNPIMLVDPDGRRFKTAEEESIASNVYDAAADRVRINQKRMDIPSISMRVASL